MLKEVIARSRSSLRLAKSFPLQIFSIIFEILFWKNRVCIAEENLQYFYLKLVQEIIWALKATFVVENDFHARLCQYKTCFAMLLYNTAFHFIIYLFISQITKATPYLTIVGFELGISLHTEGREGCHQ